MLLVNGKMFMAKDGGRYLMLESKCCVKHVEPAAMVAHYWNPEACQTTIERGTSLLSLSDPSETSDSQSTFRKKPRSEKVSLGMGVQERSCAHPPSGH